MVVLALILTLGAMLFFTALLVRMVVVAVVLTLGAMVFFIALLCWNDLMYARKGIPPGTMGFPIIGETSKFINHGPSFMKVQRARYGDLFKTHILGYPTVISMDPELNRSILTNEGKGLVPGYPKAMGDILGKYSFGAISGSTHKLMRSTMLSLIQPPVIRDQLFHKMDEFMRDFLGNWGDQTIDIQAKTKEMWLLSTLKELVSVERGPVFTALRSEIYKLLGGTLSLAINFPGTSYHRGLHARKKIVKIIKEIIAERRSYFITYGDMLDSMMRNDDPTRTKLDDEQLIDMLISFVYSGYETVSTTTMMAIKFLYEHPNVLQDVRDEHFEIRRGKSAEDAITWDEYKSMTTTRAVILETLRICNVVHGVLRKTTRDIEMNGYIIPKGWRIYVYTREMNADDKLFSHPLIFNPGRWLGNSSEFQKYFLSFGAGSRVCPGKDLGIVKIAMFLHHFVTRYRWELKGDKLLKFPRVEAPNGMQIKVWDY